MNTLTARLKARAREIGFDLVGITTPDPPLHAGFYEQWLAAGYHGEMAYLATERARARRADPRAILPECRSIVVGAVNYSTGENGPGAGVARYARGADYHDVLPAMFRELVAFVEREAGHPIAHKIYADAGPLLERDLAQRAGLGWIGKNTNLISPRLGSWLLLGEALLGIALDPDPPFEADRCGTCTRCIEACPTACILPDRTLDARRCISYLTIELKGSIPVDLRAATGGWIFGCDICQEVCPWNVRFARRAEHPAFQPRPEGAAPDPESVLSLTEAEFRERFRGTPLTRPKRHGLARNAAVALGNARDPRAAPALARAAREDPHPVVREHAEWALAPAPEGTLRGRKTEGWRG